MEEGGWDLLTFNLEEKMGASDSGGDTDSKTRIGRAIEDTHTHTN